MQREVERLAHHHAHAAPRVAMRERTLELARAERVGLEHEPELAPAAARRVHPPVPEHDPLAELVRERLDVTPGEAIVAPPVPVALEQCVVRVAKALEAREHEHLVAAQGFNAL